MHVSPNSVTFKVPLPGGLLDPSYHDADGKVTVLANAVSGAMDVVGPAEIKALDRLRAGQEADAGTLAGLLDRGYVFRDDDPEDSRYRAIVDGYFDAIQQAPFQFMFIPSFVCNLACPYCFEG